MIAHRIKTINAMRRKFDNYFENLKSITNSDIIDDYATNDLLEVRRKFAKTSYDHMVSMYLLGLTRIEDMWLKATRVAGEYLLVIFKRYLVNYYVEILGYAQPSIASLVDNLIVGFSIDGDSDILCTTTQEFVEYTFVNIYSLIQMQYTDNTGITYYQNSADRTLFEGFADVLGNLSYGLPDYLLHQQDVMDYIIQNAEISINQADTTDILSTENSNRTMLSIHRFLKVFLNKDTAIDKISKLFYPDDQYLDTTIHNFLLLFMTTGSLETTMSEALLTYDQIINQIFIDDYDNVDDLFDACTNMSCVVNRYFNVSFETAVTYKEPHERIIVNINEIGGSNAVNTVYPAKNETFHKQSKYFKLLPNMETQTFNRIMDQIIKGCDAYLNDCIYNRIEKYKDNIPYLKNRISEAIRMFDVNSLEHGSESMYYSSMSLLNTPMNITTDRLIEYFQNYNSHDLLQPIKTFHDAVHMHVVGYTTYINGYPLYNYGAIRTQLDGMFDTLAFDPNNNMRSLRDIFDVIETIDPDFDKAQLKLDILYDLYKNLPNILKSCVSESIEQIDKELELYSTVYNIRMIEQNSPFISSEFFKLLDYIYEPMFTRTADELNDFITTSLVTTVTDFLNIIYPMMYYNYVYEFGMKRIKNYNKNGNLAGYMLSEYNMDIHLSNILSRTTSIISENAKFLKLDMNRAFDRNMLYLNQSSFKNNNLYLYDLHNNNYNVDYDMNIIHEPSNAYDLRDSDTKFITQLNTMGYELLDNNDYMLRTIRKQIIDKLNGINLFNISIANDIGVKKNLKNYDSMIYYSKLNSKFYLTFDIYKYYASKDIDDIQYLLTEINKLDNSSVKVLETISDLSNITFKSSSSWYNMIDLNIIELDGLTQCSIDESKIIHKIPGAYVLYKSKAITNEEDYKYADAMIDIIIDSVNEEGTTGSFNIIDETNHNDINIYLDIYKRYRAINDLNIGEFHTSFDLVETILEYDVIQILRRTANSDSLFYTLINA